MARLTRAEREERAEIRAWAREEERIAFRCFALCLRAVHDCEWSRARAHHFEVEYLPPAGIWPMPKAEQVAA